MVITMAVNGYVVERFNIWSDSWENAAVYCPVWGDEFEIIFRDKGVAEELLELFEIENEDIRYRVVRTLQLH